jgi:hypothetical protein
MLNPNWVLAAIVAVVLLTTGAVLAVVLAGGQDVLVRAGIFVGLAGTVIPALLALLAAVRAQAAVSGHLADHADPPSPQVR